MTRILETAKPLPLSRSQSDLDLLRPWVFVVISNCFVVQR